MTRWLSKDIRYPRRLRAALVLLLVLAIGLDLGESYLRIVDQHDNALLQVSTYVTSHIPADDIVVADEPVGVMIPQKYCKLESAANCPNAKWVITYTSITQQLPTQTSDPQLYALLDGAQVVSVFRGFKETITVYRVVGGGTTPSPPPIPTPTTTPVVVPTTSPAAVPTNTPIPYHPPTPTPVPTATSVPTATPSPTPTP